MNLKCSRVNMRSSLSAGHAILWITWVRILPVFRIVGHALIQYVVNRIVDPIDFDCSSWSRNRSIVSGATVGWMAVAVGTECDRGWGVHASCGWQPGTAFLMGECARTVTLYVTGGDGGEPLVLAAWGLSGYGCGAAQRDRGMTREAWLCISSAHDDKGMSRRLFKRASLVPGLNPGAKRVDYEAARGGKPTMPGTLRGTDLDSRHPTIVVTLPVLHPEITA